MKHIGFKHQRENKQNSDNKIFKHFIYLATISAIMSSLRVPLTVTSDLHIVKIVLEDNRRCLNQVLFPDTHSRNLIRLVMYSLIVPGMRVPFCSSRSITSPASPMDSSCKMLSELSSDRKNLTPVMWFSTVPVDLPALSLLLVTFFLKKEEEIYSKSYYAVAHTMENILSLICSGSHLICSRSHLICSRSHLGKYSVLYVVDHSSENILSLICSGSHLICSGSHLVCSCSQCNM